MPHAIITGGSSGIGKALAIQLAAQGYQVGLIGRDISKGDLALQEVLNVQKGLKPSYFKAADVGNAFEITRVIQDAIATHGAPDLLITSAGIAVPGYFQELPLDNFEKTMQINFLGTVYAVKAVLPSMQARGTGQVVVISSGAGLTGVFGYTSYGASKFALRGFAEALRAELKPVGVSVSIVYPPDTDTPQLIEENKTKPVETKKISGNVKPMSAEAVATCILKGIAKKKFGIAPGFEMKLLMRINSIAANLLYAHFDRIIKKYRRSQHN